MKSEENGHKTQHGRAGRTGPETREGGASLQRPTVPRPGLGGTCDSHNSFSKLC